MPVSSFRKTWFSTLIIVRSLSWERSFWSVEVAILFFAATSYSDCSRGRRFTLLYGDQNSFALFGVGQHPTAGNQTKIWSPASISHFFLIKVDNFVGVHFALE